MLGMGRVGGIVGATMGAWLFQVGLDYQDIFQVLLIPGFIAAFALLGLMLKWKQEGHIATLRRKKTVTPVAEPPKKC